MRGLRTTGLLLAVALLVCAPGCRQLRGYRTPDDIARWQDTAPPRLSLAAKAEGYQLRLEERHQLPEGLIRYMRIPAHDESTGGYGNLADGPFFLGTYLASQSLRYAVTGDAAALEQVRVSLRGMALLAEVSGERGLLARYFSPVAPSWDARWRPSPTHPELHWRPDVSKDQYAGYVHGLGVALALLHEPEIRAELTELACAVADHLIENDLRLVDWDGERTKYGDLRGRILGVPIGVNALISLAAAKVAAVATGAPRYVDFYRDLIDRGYADISYWAHFSVFGYGNRTNDNMAYLVLYPLLLLEDDPEIVRALRAGARRSWEHVGGDRNAFFAFVQAAVAGDPSVDAEEIGRARDEGRRALFEFPEEKWAWSVDLTRDGFDFPRSFWRDSHGQPRSKVAVPPYLRPGASSLWASDPFLLVGRLGSEGEIEFAGIDYLIAYWIGRHHGFVAAGE